MFGILLTMAYDGERFSGWAKGVPPERTVQAVLHQAIATMDPAGCIPRGASRTDAGVHAEGQVAAFDTAREIEPRGWVLGLNAALDEDVAVRAAQRITAGFDPRTVSRGKRYRYRILLDQVRDPLWRGRTWRIGYPLDLEKMTREAARAEGTHDFRAFRSARDERRMTVRTLERVAVERESDRVIAIVVRGNAFMHNMVRIIAGTLVDVARGQLQEGAIERAIASGARDDLGTTAPAHGLVLEHVDLGIDGVGGAQWPP
jgi:tRNA pseudouridine38-40 synthase